MRSFKLIAFMTVMLLLLGCAHYQVNPLLEKYEKDAGYRFKNIHSPDNTDSLFIVLAFSGGGTRAAALSYGVLEYLRDTTITWEGQTRRLLDEVDVISSVSGGSFTATYYGLFGDRIFKDFEHKFLKKDIEECLLCNALSPFNWCRFASPFFNRIDMAAEYYDEHVFEKSTFKDLMQRGRRPFILINATDMSLGARFEFTQDQFDLICSDLSGLPVARAVAASSAFPILLSPLTMKNYAGQCNYQEPSWVALAMKDMYIAPRRYLKAIEIRSYLDQSPEKRRKYIHLLDGGIADNVGIRGPHGAIFSHDSGWGVLKKINENKVKKMAFIAVNAKTEPDITFDRKESAPGLVKVLEETATAPMDNYTFDTLDLLNESFKLLQKDAQSVRDCKEVMKEKCPAAEADILPMPEPELYPVVIGFDALKDEKERHFFNNLPTNFSLSSKIVDCLRQVAGKLLNESPKFQEFLEKLSGQQPSPPFRQEIIDACVKEGDGT